jgi:acyl carrier protein
MTMIDESQLRAAAREVVFQLVGSEVDDADALISGGMIDSLSIVKLIGQIERKLGVVLPLEDVQPDDFDSIDLVVETFQRLARAR